MVFRGQYGVEYYTFVSLTAKNLHELESLLVVSYSKHGRHKVLVIRILITEDQAGSGDDQAVRMEPFLFCHCI